MLVAAFCMLSTTPAMAQFNLGKAVGGAAKAVKAATLTDADVANYVKEYITWMDQHNQVCADDNPYAIRLKKLTEGLTNVEGIPLNFKVYYVIDVNAFACADGSVRVFSSLMDIMTDDELLAIIGHEIGHVKNEDTKDAIKAAYTRAALQEAGSAASSTVKALSESQIGEMAEAMLDAKHSKKQESQADEYSYNFMKKHGYNVVGVYTAFKKLALLSGGETQSRFQKMMSSHPDSEKRAEAAKKRAIKDGLWKDPGEVKLPTTPIE